MTTRGLDEDGCRAVAALLDRVCREALRVQAEVRAVAVACANRRLAGRN